METRLSYSLAENGQAENGECNASLSEKGLSIESGTPLLIPYRDISGMDASDYTIAVSLVSGGTLRLSQLGYKYEDFARELSRLLNDSTLRDLLMDEPKEKMRTNCDFSRSPLSTPDTSIKSIQGECELRLYDTGLVFIPKKGSLIRIPLGEMSCVEKTGLSLSVKSESDGVFIFSKMGRDADPFRKALSDSINALYASTQAMLQETLPEAGHIQLRKASSLMRDGKAAKRFDLESIAPGLFTALERKVDPAGLRENYDHLLSLARKERMALGVKRGLMGEGSEYIWFLFPIYSVDSRPGNVVALEAASLSEDAEGSGKATYFFRLMGRDPYKARRGIEGLDAAFDSFLMKINRCMIRINFRREPIYLPDASFQDPKYARYRFALARIPELKELRSLFIGRVIHRSAEQWKKDVAGLMEFNARAKNDSEKWQGPSETETGNPAT